MASISLKTCSFNRDEFNAALSNIHADASDIATRQHSDYLFGYLAALGTGTLVVESPYTDGDYLDDFTAYYAKCFSPFESSCKRLHFFRGSFALEAATKISSGTLSRPEASQLIEDYLGFIVARPLPQAIIGRTVLKTFDPDGGRRFYPAVKDYSANLIGINLPVRSLAFQEQDTVLAACATVALWSCFQKAAHLFGTTAPTPSVITRASQAFHYGRTFPSQGLTILEMCAAIRHVGLEPEVIDVKDRSVPLLSLIYAHLQLGVPLVLVAEVPGGLHAISLVGYSLRAEPVHAMEMSEASTVSLPMSGLRIDKFYGHDDQVGPFCRLHVRITNAQGVPFSIKFVRQSAEITPIAVLVPLYHKVRLTFLDVHSWLNRLNGAIKLVFPADARYEWDVALCFSNEYKAFVRESESAAPEVKRRILMSSQPRFIWRCALRLNGTDLMHIIFDATGIARSFPVYMVSWWHSALADILKMLFSNPALDQQFRQILTDRFFDLLKRGLDTDYPVACAFDN
jgi:hypothetical protein